MEQNLTLKEAAKVFCVTTGTVRRWIKTGKLEACKAGRKFIVSMSTIKKAIKAYSATAGIISKSNKVRAY